MHFSGYPNKIILFHSSSQPKQGFWLQFICFDTPLDLRFRRTSLDCGRLFSYRNLRLFLCLYRPKSSGRGYLKSYSVTTGIIEDNKIHLEWQFLLCCRCRFAVYRYFPEGISRVIVHQKGTVRKDRHSDRSTEYF